MNSAPIHLLVDNQPIAESTLVEQQEVELSVLPPAGSSLSLRIGAGSDPLPPFLRPGDPAWRWRWNPRNAVGRFTVILEIVWPDAHMEMVQTTLDVRPRKIDQDRYTLLLEHLQQSASALLFRLSSATIGTTPIQSDQVQTLIEQYGSLFGERFAILEQAILRMARRPQTHLHSRLERVETGQVRDFADLARSISAMPHPDAPLPAQVMERRIDDSVDLYEHRLLKRLLQELRRRAEFIQAGTTATAYRSDATTSLITALQTVNERLRALQALPFLAELQPLSHFHGPSHLMQHDPNYRQVYRYWQTLRRHPLVELDNPLLHIPLHELPYLYECWCALQLAQAVLDLPGATIQQQHLITAQNAAGMAEHSDETLLNAPAFALGLTRDVPLLVIEYRGMLLKLRYQPAYKAHSPQRQARQPVLISLDCHTRVPDMVIEIEQAGAAPALLVFDAKYRLDARGSVPEDALADAYSYLGSIGTVDGNHAVRLVILCYPGQGHAQVYRSGVGVLPLLPGAIGELGAWLATHIHACTHDP